MRRALEVGALRRGWPNSGALIPDGSLVWVCLGRCRRLGAPLRVVPRAAERDFASLEGEKDRFVLEQCRVSAECDELNKVHDQQFT